MFENPVKTDCRRQALQSTPAFFNNIQRLIFRTPSIPHQWTSIPFALTIFPL